MNLEYAISFIGLYFKQCSINITFKCQFSSITYLCPWCLRAFKKVLHVHHISEENFLISSLFWFKSRNITRWITQKTLQNLFSEKERLKKLRRIDNLGKPFKQLFYYFYKFLTYLIWELFNNLCNHLLIFY